MSATESTVAGTTKLSRKIKLGLIGTGGMANNHAENFARIPGCEIVAACDVDLGRVTAFAAKHKIGKIFTHLEDFLDNGHFDAVSNVTPDRFHGPVSLAALSRGMHVLCEKPLAVSYAEAEQMTAAAHSAGVINMVHFSYRNASAVQKAAELVREGAIGRVMHVDASYFQDWLAGDHWGRWSESPAWLWRLSTAHGSKGVLGDVGVHLIDFATFPAGPLASLQCVLRTFPKAPGDRVGDYALDANDSAVITASFRDGALGSFRASRWATGHRNSVSLEIYGDEGGLRIDLDRSYTELEICRVKNRNIGAWEKLDCGVTSTIYERFITSIRTGVNDQPDFARGAEIQQALDACEQSHAEGRAVQLE